MPMNKEQHSILKKFILDQISSTSDLDILSKNEFYNNFTSYNNSDMNNNIKNNIYENYLDVFNEVKKDILLEPEFIDKILKDAEENPNHKKLEKNEFINRFFLYNSSNIPKGSAYYKMPHQKIKRLKEEDAFNLYNEIASKPTSERIAHGFYRKNKLKEISPEIYNSLFEKYTENPFNAVVESPFSPFSGVVSREKINNELKKFTNKENTIILKNFIKKNPKLHGIFSEDPKKDKKIVEEILNYDESEDKYPEINATKLQRYKDIVDALENRLESFKTGDKEKIQKALEEHNKLKLILEYNEPEKLHQYKSFKPSQQNIYKYDKDIDKIKKNYKKLDSKLPEIPMGEKFEAQHGPAYRQKADKTFLEAAIAQFNEPLHQYQTRNGGFETTMVDPSDLEQHARQLLYADNPNVGDLKIRQNKLEEDINRYTKDKNAQKSVNPYLSKIDIDPYELYQRMFKSHEDEYEKYVREKALDDLNRNIIPKLQAQHLSGGTRGSGRYKRSIDEAVENYMKGTTGAILGNRTGNRQLSINAAQGYTADQLNAARTSMQAATQDRENELKAISTLEEARKLHNLEKEKHRKEIAYYGAEDRARQQMIMDERIKVFNEARDYPKEQLREQSNILARHQFPIMKTSVGEPVERLNTMHAPIAGNTNLGIGNIMASMGAKMARHKKGGKVKNLKKATGGQVNMINEAMQNAVVDGGSAVNALRALLHHSVGMQAIYGVPKAYAIGGQVIADPIISGAKKAKEFVDHTEYKEYLKTRKQAKEHSFLKDMIDAAMTGAANSPGAFGNIGNSYMKTANKLDARNTEEEAMAHEAYKAEHELARYEREQQLKNQEMQLRQQHEETIASHYKDMANANRIKLMPSEGIDVNDIPTKKLSKEAEHIINKNTEVLTGLQPLKDREAALAKRLEGIEGGPAISFLVKKLGWTGAAPYVASFLHNLKSKKTVTAQQLLDASDAEAEFLTELKEFGSTNKGSRFTNAILQAYEAGKPGIGKGEISNKENSQSVKKKIKRLENNALEQSEVLGASPNTLSFQRSRIEDFSKSPENENVLFQSTNPVNSPDFAYTQIQQELNRIRQIKDRRKMKGSA